jgi:hypothetical protein
MTALPLPVFLRTAGIGTIRSKSIGVSASPESGPRIAARIAAIVSGVASTVRRLEM